MRHLHADARMNELSDSRRTGSRPRTRGRRGALGEDFDALGRQLERRGIEIEAITDAVQASRWPCRAGASGTGGTRFARFPGPGEPRNIFEKLEDCARHPAAQPRHPHASRRISPGTRSATTRRCARRRQGLGLGFDAVNSNTFQDQPGQKLCLHSARSPTPSRRRAQQAVAHNIECIEIGRQLGSTALTVWVGDGTNFPASRTSPAPRPLSRSDAADLRGAARRLADAARAQALRAGLLFHGDLRLGQLSSPRRSSDPRRSAWSTSATTRPTSISSRSWRGSSASASSAASTSTTANMATTTSIRARSTRTSCSSCSTSWSMPRTRKAPGFAPAYMIDQSHNVTDPIESLMHSARRSARLCAGAAGRPRGAAAAQEANDALGAHRISSRLRHRCLTDPCRGPPPQGGALEPIAVYRAAGYRAARRKSGRRARADRVRGSSRTRCCLRPCLTAADASEHPS